MNAKPTNSRDERPRYGLLAACLVGLGGIAAAAPYGCQERTSQPVAEQAAPMAVAPNDPGAGPALPR